VSSAPIVNASPLVFLGNAGRLDLLQSLGGGRIAVPSVVAREVTETHHHDRARAVVAAATWIERIEPVDVPESVVRWGLDRGEAQVVAMGLANPGALLVIDDLAGRKCAIAHRLDVIGTRRWRCGCYAAARRSRRP